MANQLPRKRFSIRLARVMEEHDMSATDIVRASDGVISFANMNHWMNGYYPTHDTLILLLGILRQRTKKNVSLEWLMGLNSDEED